MLYNGGMKQEIIKISEEIGIGLIGFCDLKIESNLKEKYEYQKLNKLFTSFQIGNIDDKLLISPKYKNYKSAIVVGLPYEKRDIMIKPNEVYFSSCAWGEDYHIKLKNKLNIIAEFIIANGGKYEIFVDNNCLDERYLAYKAGLGFYGKNYLLINEKYGSHFFIGVLLTDLSFPYDSPIKTQCLKCDKCIEVCPTKSLGKGVLNGTTCLSYLTQKKNLTEEEGKYINKCVYGCDICQNVCPHNKDIINNIDSEGIEVFKKDEFLNMSQENYEKAYNNNASFWRGKSIIDRNIILSSKNKIDSKKTL